MVCGVVELAANTTCFAVGSKSPALVVTSVKVTFTFAAVSIGFDNDTVNCMVPAASSTVASLMVNTAVSSLTIEPVATACASTKYPALATGVSTTVSFGSTVVLAEGSIVTVAVVLPAGIFTEPAEFVNVIAPDCA